MKRYIAALLLAFCFLLTLTPTTAGAETIEDRASLLMGLGIFNGYGDGDLRLGNNVTRAEFTKVAVAASSYRNAVPAGLAVSPYADVPYSHWAAPYIRLAADNGLVTGYLDSTFRPDANVSYEESITMSLRLLGYGTEDFGSSWPYGQIGLAKNLNLTDNISRSIGEAMTREDIVNLIYNLLYTDKKGTQSAYFDTLDCKLTEDVTVIATAAEDASVGGGRVYTSAGTFRMGDGFREEYIGRTGDLIVQNSDTILAFLPEAQTAEEYNVDAAIGADLILDGRTANLESGLTVYHKTQKTTYENIIPTVNAGSRFVIYRDANGVIDYAFLFNNDVKSTALEELEKYVVYSKLNDAVIAYANGSMQEIPVEDGTTCYRDNQKSTYGAMKANLAMGDLIYVKRSNTGIVDYISVEKGSVQGPVTVTAGAWSSLFGDISAMTVMRNGQRSSADALESNDIAYFQSDLNMILAYSNKVTGVYSDASPNKDLPESVTVSGTQYEIESVAAFDKLCSGGTFGFGDTVTLLLGKDGKVADVVAPGAQSSTITGYLADAGKKDFTRSDGELYSAYYASIVGADGKAYEYVAKQDYSSRKNSIMTVSFTDGVASLSWHSYPKTALGTVDAANKKIGTEKLADNVQILDISTTDAYKQGSYQSVYLKRLDGVKLNSGDVLYYEKDAQNRITQLILNNVTGDCHKYGVVTAAQSRSSDMNISGSYTVDIGGTAQSVNTSSKTFSVYAGQPVQIVYNGNQIDSMITLQKVSGTVTSVDSTSIRTSSRNAYLLADDVLVYRKQSQTKFLKIPLADIIGSPDGTVEAYYDKAQTGGGRIRILVVS